MGLTHKEIEAFKKQLLELREQISKAVQGATEEMRSEDGGPKGMSQHQADEGTDDFSRTISIEVGSKEQSILRQINRCLEKIEEGTYGICDITGEPIPKKRLEAIPYATMTVAAQEKMEKGLF